MKSIVALAVWTLAGVAMAQPSGIYDIRAYGALGGDRLDTAAIQKAVDAAWRAGGGEVVVPEGFFRTGGIRLRSNVTLHLLEGAVLEGSWNCEDYDILERDPLEPVENLPTNGLSRSACVTSRWNHALIRAYKAHNVAIVGERHSLIDGQNCYDAQGEEKYRGPHAVSFWDCTGVTLRGYTIRNSANWAHIVVRCPETRFENIVVRGGHDGLDIHCCTGTVIRACRFYTGDDAIAGFGNVRTRVSDCVFCCSCNDVRFGGTDALFERCRSVRPAPWGHRYRLSDEDKALARNHGEATRHDGNLFTYYCDSRWGAIPKPGNIVFRDCQFDGVNRPCVVDWGARWGNFMPLEDVTFENCRFTNLRQGFKVNACPEKPITIHVKGSSFEAAPEARGLPFVEGAHYKFVDLDAARVMGLVLSQCR